MANAAGPNPSVRCYHCGTVVNKQEAQAITVDPDGTMRVWTSERADYSERYGYVPRLRHLCLTCDSDLFGDAAQDGDEAGE